MSKSDFLTNLKVIETKGRSMGMQMRKEAAVARQELADRQRKGLTGDAAIAHFHLVNHFNLNKYGM